MLEIGLVKKIEHCHTDFQARQRLNPGAQINDDKARGGVLRERWRYSVLVGNKAAPDVGPTPA